MEERVQVIFWILWRSRVMKSCSLQSPLRRGISWWSGEGTSQRRKRWRWREEFDAWRDARWYWKGMSRKFRLIEGYFLQCQNWNIIPLFDTFSGSNISSSKLRFIFWRIFFKKFLLIFHEFRILGLDWDGFAWNSILILRSKQFIYFFYAVSYLQLSL